MLAKEENVPLIDLNAMSKMLYEAWGPDLSKQAFAPNDNTHHNNYGSYELAKCIVAGIKATKNGLASYLVSDVAAFDPGRPDSLESFALPPSPKANSVKPLGN